MRTILTLDDDVSVQLERLRRAQGTSLKDLVNEALRRGLREMTATPKNRKPSARSPGICAIPDGASAIIASLRAIGATEVLSPPETCGTSRAAMSSLAGAGLAAMSSM